MNTPTQPAVIIPEIPSAAATSSGAGSSGSTNIWRNRFREQRSDASHSVVREPFACKSLK
ncbi:MAG: hypothetical protein WBW41_10585 [Verrucomicrobiia bacterium]